MRKHIKTFLLIINVAAILFLSSQKLYASALHFIVYGDTRQDILTMEKPQRKHNAIAKVIREMNPEFILFTGDMIYYKEYNSFLKVISNNYIGDKAIPLYPSIGNHELVFGKEADAIIKEILKKVSIEDKSKRQTSSHAGISNDIEKLKRKLNQTVEAIPEEKLKARSRQVLCEIFKDKLNPAYASYLNEVLIDTSEGQTWYSFVKEINGLKIKFIALNSSLPGDEEQFQWFLNELKQFSGPKIIFEHYPVYSIGFHGCKDLLNNESKASRFRDRYAKFFNDTANNIVLVISGHEHNYQRFYKTDKNGGMQIPVYVVSGGGGAELKGTADCDVSEIPLDGFHYLGLITAYNFVDIVADTDDKKNLVLKCKVLGLRYDITDRLPNDDTVEKEFVKDNMELIDDFTLNQSK